MRNKKIATEFKCKSSVGFNNCAGAIDGLLIWTQKPTNVDCKAAKCDVMKFMCGRKHKFGLNCQAVCDVNCKFLDMSIIFPGSTSDCLAFEGSNLFWRLENGLLHDNFCLYGDNAYINTKYMAMPYSEQCGSDKDVTIFTYHS